MICESCKNNIPDTAKFCPVCGAKIEPQKPVEAAEIPAAPVVAPPVAEQAPVAPPVATPAPARDMTTPVADKPKSNNTLLWIIVLIILIGAGGVGGYICYNTFFKKEAPQFDSQPMPGMPEQGQMQPQQPPMQPQTMTPQLLTKVEIKASSLVSDIKNGKPSGFATSFLVGASRVAHYVQYQKAVPGQTTFGSQFLKEGVPIFKCGPKPLQYPSGNYFCQATQGLEEGNYEVRFTVDGVESQILRFKVTY